MRQCLQVGCSGGDIGADAEMPHVPGRLCRTRNRHRTLGIGGDLLALGPDPAVRRLAVLPCDADRHSARISLSENCSSRRAHLRLEAGAVPFCQLPVVPTFLSFPA